MRLPACPHCGSPVRQYSRRPVTTTAVECYANCTSPSCPEAGSTLVYTVGYDRTVNKRQSITFDMAAAIVNALPPAERLKLAPLIHA